MSEIMRFLGHILEIISEVTNEISGCYLLLAYVRSFLSPVSLLGDLSGYMGVSTSLLVGNCNFRNATTTCTASPNQS